MHTSMHLIDLLEIIVLVISTRNLCESLAALTLLNIHPKGWHFNLFSHLTVLASKNPEGGGTTGPEEQQNRTNNARERWVPVVILALH